MTVRSCGEALLEVEPPKSLEEWSTAMKSMQKRMKNAPGNPNPRCYRYKWATRSFWDFRLRQQGILPGMSYSKASMVIVGKMAMHDHSRARALVSNALLVLGASRSITIRTKPQLLQLAIRIALSILHLSRCKT